MPTSTTVKGLNINELTEAQYDAAVLGGVIGPNELSVLTDVSYVEPSDLATVATTGDYDDLINKPTIPAAIQVSSMPVASVDELDKIYQFVGATDVNYTNGYFYKCVSDGQTPATYSWEQTDVQPAGSLLPDQTGHSGQFLTTDGTDASWAAVSALQNTATGTESLSVGKATTANNVVTVVNSDAASVTTGQGSAVVGSGAVSQARDGVALGRLASVYSYNGEYGIAIGGNSSTRGRSGINIGYGAGSNGGNGDYGIAIGREAQAKQNYSIQLGNGSNNEAGTFYVASYYNSANVNYKLMDADGTIPTARFTTDPVADGTYVPTLTISSGVATRSWSAPSGGLPSQTGNSGKFLTTDGTDASWVKGFKNISTNNYGIAICWNNTSSVGYWANYNIAIGSPVNTAGETVQIGHNTKSGDYSVVIGNVAETNNTMNSVAVGYMAKAHTTHTNYESVAIGSNAETLGDRAIALGTNSKSKADYAIQLGCYYDTNASNWSANTDANTFKVANANGNFEMMSADGTIPEARLADTTNAQQGQVLTLDNTGNAVWQTPSTAVTSTTATLVVADWVANTQTLTVSGVTSSNVVIVSPQPLSSGDYATAGVLCTAQNTNSLTFTCTQTPSNAIDLSIVIIG